MNRYVNWDLVERKYGRVSEDFYARRMQRLIEHPTAIRGRPSPRWEEMTDAEVAESVGLSEEDVRALEDRCTPDAPAPARSTPEPDPGGG